MIMRVTKCKGQERILETLYGAKGYFYFSTRLGPVGKERCTRIVSSDGFCTLQFVEGGGGDNVNF